MKEAFKRAFITTIPVLLGYLSIGTAFGLLINDIGYNFIWAGFMSLVIYAGTMQYMMVNILASGTGLIETALITLMIHLRHMAYGLSFIQRFKNMGKKKLYMIFSLTDETYALLCMSKSPKGIDENKYLFAIALLNQSYWILGSILGAAAGSLLTINTKGIDFAMTALFIVLCTEQWMSFPSRKPVITGAICGVAALALFGAANMLVPAMIGIIGILLVLRKKIEPQIMEEKG